MKRKTAYYTAAAVIVVLAVYYRTHTWNHVRSGIYSRMLSPGKNIHLVSGHIADVKTNLFKYKNDTGSTKYLVYRSRSNAGPSGRLTVSLMGNAYSTLYRPADVKFMETASGGTIIESNGNTRRDAFIELLFVVEPGREIEISAAAGQGQKVIID